MSAELGAPLLAGFPRIDRYFPHCRVAALEAAARFRFGIADFGKLYGRHTFAYRRPEGPIRFRENGVELDLELHREPVPEDELDAAIAYLYGLSCPVHAFNRFDAYLDFCRGRLAHGIPVVTNFDLMFIRNRREYGRVSNPHTIVLIGHDAGSGGFHAAEQMLDRTFVPLEDLTRCFEYQLEVRSKLEIWELTRDGEGRELRRDDALQRIRANLENLKSSDDRRGLLALTRFEQELSEFLDSASYAGQPFSIPGIWVFSHERNIERKWLAAIAPLCPTAAHGLLDEFNELLKQSFNHWLSLDYLLEKCLAANDGRALRSLPKYLAAIDADERRAVTLWNALDDELAND